MKMKTYSKLLIILIFSLLFSSTTVFASSETFIVEPDVEYSINDDYDAYLNQKKKKSDFTINDEDKYNIYFSRGTIIANRGENGEEFTVNEKNLEILIFQTDADNELYFVVDYNKVRDNVILLGKTTEQELSSLTSELTVGREVAEDNDITLEKIDEEIPKPEMEKINKFKYSNNLLVGLVVLISAIIFVIVKKYKGNE